MQNWVFYGIIAAICFGVNTIIYKIAYQKGNFSAAYGSLVFGSGILLTFLVYFLMNPSLHFEWKSTTLALISGIIWAIGFLAIAIAISKGGEIAKLAPLFNTNTIIAVFLGMVLLKEVPDASQIWRIVAGTIMIIAGAVLVSI